MRVNDLRGYAEKIISACPEKGRGAFAPTGDPYVTLCSGGIKPEGEFFPLLCSDKQTAIKEWWYAFLEYLRERTDLMLYWREYPKTVRVRDMVIVKSRLVIAEKRKRQ